jgi:hypothetical protein
MKSWMTKKNWILKEYYMLGANCGFFEEERYMVQLPIVKSGDQLHLGAT